MQNWGSNDISFNMIVILVKPGMDFLGVQRCLTPLSPLTGKSASDKYCQYIDKNWNSICFKLLSN